MKINKKYMPFFSRTSAVIISLLFCFTACSTSVISTNPSESDTDETTNDVSLSYTIAFAEPTIRSMILRDQSFSKIDMKGTFLTSEKRGDPMMPAKPLAILLPQGTEFIDMSVTADELCFIATGKIDLLQQPIAPYQGQIPLGLPPSDSLLFNEDTYSDSMLYPGKLKDHVSIGYCRGYTILMVTLYPTIYNPGEGSFAYYPSINLDISLKDTGIVHPLYRGIKEDRQWVENLVMNPAMEETYQSSKGSLYPAGLCNPSDNNGQGYDYVIITTDALFDFTGTYTWDDLINRKESEGISATKITVEDIVACSDYWDTTDPLFNDSAALIREFCKDAYQDWNTQYILIGGDDDGVNKIERREMDGAAESSVETDIYWTHLDNTFNADGDNDWGEEEDGGFDFYSEMYSGSIPCDVGSDVSNWLTKSFYYADAYDTDYLDNAAFFGGDTGWDAQSDTILEFSAIQGTNDWTGPNPYGDGPYPSWLGFQWGFETWNAHYPQSAFNLSVKWTAEPTNPGWQGGTSSSAIAGFKEAINNDQCTVISAIAHANSGMSMDVYSSTWESEYHNTKPFFLTDQGCHCGDMDASDDGVLHSMLFHSDTELAFACVYNTGYGWGNYDGTNASSAMQMKAFWDYMFDLSNNSQSTSNWQLGKAQEWARDLLAPAIDWNPDGDDGAFRNTIQSCLLFGDPAQRLKVPFIPDHDIMVDGLVIPPVVAHGETQTVSATVRNVGNNTETGIVVDFKVDGFVEDTVTIPSLESMGSTTVEFSWDPALGTYLVAVESQPIPSEYDLLNNQVNRTVDVIPAPAIDVTPDQLSFYVPTDASDSDMFTIKNLITAEGTLYYNISYSDSWLSTNNTMGSIMVGGSDTIMLSVDSTGLSEGDYVGYVMISSNDLDDPEVMVLVDMTVVYGNDMKAVSINNPTGVIPAGSYTVDATVQNLGYYPQTDVLVNCSIYEGGIGGDVYMTDFSTEPIDWTITNIVGTAWTWDSYDERMENSYSGSPVGYLDSPVLDCSGKTGISLSFWHYWRADYSSGNQDGYVRGSIDGGDTFPFLIDSFHHNNPAEEEEVKYYDISSWADGQAEVMVRFDINNDNDWYWRIDDFNVSAEITGPLVYYSEELIDIDQYETQTVAFSPTWNPGMGVYGVQVSTLLVGDESTGNDVIAEVVYVEGPNLWYDPTSHDFGTMLINENDDITFQICNTGIDTLDYSLDESYGWLMIYPLSGSLGPGECDTITITVNTTGLTPGMSYHGDIMIISNGGSGTFGVDVYVIADPPESIDQSVYDRGFPIRHALDGDWAAAQSFTIDTDVIISISVFLRVFGTPEFDLTIELRQDSPEGPVLESAVFTPGEIPTSWGWLNIPMSVIADPGVEYYIVMPPAPSGVTTSFGYEWAYAFGNQYDGGAFWFTRDGGALWRDLPAMYEFTFRVN